MATDTDTDSGDSTAKAKDSSTVLVEVEVDVDVDVEVEEEIVFTNGGEGREGEEEYKEELEGVYNFRDVGRTVNVFMGRRILREGVLYRSARPDDATPADRARLVGGEFGIRTVVDLRTKTEHLNAAKKRQRQGQAEQQPGRIPGLRYVSVKLTGRAFERFLISQLSWWSFLKLVFLFLCGLRMRAIRVMGREVMAPRGLVRLGLDTLDNSRAEIAETLKSLTAPAALPALVHCTQGKDRTGLVVALALMALNCVDTDTDTDTTTNSTPSERIRIPLPAIRHDYALTGAALSRQPPAERAERMAEIRAIGLPDGFGDAPPGMIDALAAHLEARYGGVAAYLDGIGFGPAERARLGEVLLC